MIERKVTVREGEYLGPVDWSHETARDMPSIWREAEREPSRFTFNGREIIAIGMYDGWPYWKPRPAVLFVGPLGRGEWNHFTSYGVHADSIREKRAAPEREK